MQLKQCCTASSWQLQASIREMSAACYQRTQICWNVAVAALLKQLPCFKGLLAAAAGSNGGGGRVCDCKLDSLTLAHCVASTAAAHTDAAAAGSYGSGWRVCAGAARSEVCTIEVHSTKLGRKANIQAPNHRTVWPPLLLHLLLLLLVAYAHVAMMFPLRAAAAGGDGSGGCVCAGAPGCERRHH
jgi:hypothetical protein